MSKTTTITKGDTLLPVNALLLNGNGTQLDLTDYTVKFRMVNKSNGTVEIDDQTTGITKHPTQAFTADTTNDWLKKNDHGLKDGQQIVLATTGTLPAGLTTATRYFVQEASPNVFKVALTPNGPSINITDTGSGSHTFYLVGSVQYDWQPGDVDETGEYLAHIRVFSGSERVTVPNDGDTWLVVIKGN
jgi:hypothetical protein